MITRDTIQKKLVREAVRELDFHACAEDIYSHIVKKHPTISKGTVYRNLSLLCSQGIIKRVGLPGTADRYDKNVHDHYHAQCIECGRVVDVDMEYEKDLEKRVKQTDGNVYLGHDIVFRGICSECNKGLMNNSTAPKTN